MAFMASSPNRCCCNCASVKDLFVPDEAPVRRQWLPRLHLLTDVAATAHPLRACSLLTKRQWLSSHPRLASSPNRCCCNRTSVKDLFVADEAPVRHQWLSRLHLLTDFAATAHLSRTCPLLTKRQWLFSHPCLASSPNRFCCNCISVKDLSVADEVPVRHQ